MWEAVWWLSIGVLVYTVLLYPAVLACWARWRRRAAPDRCPYPPPVVTVLIPAHNEAGVIGEKVRNTLALAYPADRREVLVVCDGCTDDTATRARAVATSAVRVLELDSHVGKAAALNRGVSEASGEVVVATDAGCVLPPEALAHVIPHFADPAVGCVCGGYAPAAADARSAAVYYRVEMRLRTWEAAIRTTLSGTGGVMAFRRGEFAPLPPETIHDDFVLPARIALSGQRVLCVPAAAARAMAPRSLRGWYRRRVRVVYGNWQLPRLLPALLRPQAGYLAWVFLSHKLARHLLPVAMLLAWATAPAVSPGLFAGISLVGAAALISGASGWVAAARGRSPGPFALGLLYAAAWCHATAAWFLRRPIPWR